VAYSADTFEVNCVECHGLRQAWIAALQNDPLFARWFAPAYAGVDTD
jgi:mono/diheme cytochrome c family protein